MRDEGRAKGERVSYVANAVLPMAEKPDDPSACRLDYRLETGHDVGREG
jgi:hypothetical protein